MSERPSPPYGTAWIIFFLVTSGVGFFMGIILGGLAGFALTLAGVGPNPIKLIAAGIGFVISIPISYFTFRWVVGEYIVKAMTPPAPPPASPPLVAPPLIEIPVPPAQEPPTEGTLPGT